MPLVGYLFQKHLLPIPVVLASAQGCGTDVLQEWIEVPVLESTHVATSDRWEYQGCTDAHGVSLEDGVAIPR